MQNGTSGCRCCWTPRTRPWTKSSRTTGRPTLTSASSSYSGRLSATSGPCPETKNAVIVIQPMVSCPRPSSPSSSLSLSTRNVCISVCYFFGIFIWLMSQISSFAQRLSLTLFVLTGFARNWLRKSTCCVNMIKLQMTLCQANNWIVLTTIN